MTYQQYQNAKIKMNNMFRIRSVFLEKEVGEIKNETISEKKLTNNVIEVFEENDDS
jgi:hypothetical protein